MKMEFPAVYLFLISFLSMQMSFKYYISFWTFCKGIASSLLHLATFITPPPQPTPSQLIFRVILFYFLLFDIFVKSSTHTAGRRLRLDLDLCSEFRESRVVTCDWLIWLLWHLAFMRTVAQFTPCQPAQKWKKRKKTSIAVGFIFHFVWASLRWIRSIRFDLLLPCSMSNRFLFTGLRRSS